MADRTPEEYDKLLSERDQEIERLKTELIQLRDQYNVVSDNYQQISNAFFWKITKPIRSAVHFVRIKTQKYPKLYQGLRYTKKAIHYGPKETWRRYKARRKPREAWKGLMLVSEEEREKERKTHFPRRIKFSILVPLYNTPETFLREMIQSVLDQTYSKWELCLADGSDDSHGEVQNICMEYSRKDNRIRYQKLEKNLGISGNTNACIEMATGNYIALFDHDDLLHPSALYEVMKAICEQNADYIYTDEATFQSPDITKIITMHFKPDFAPDNLLANNYICHFSVFSAQVLKKAGGFRSAYDGSQDHDIILRLTEKADKIVHIPKILYLWRSHPQSVAQDIGAKEYAVNAAKSAVRDFLRDYRHVDVDVISTRAFPTIFEIRYPIEKEAKISIIIPNKDHVEDLHRCINSILGKTRYTNYEIIIVENNSENKDTFDYYEVLKKNPNIQIVTYQGSFNYSKINNFGASFATGDYYLLLNNDTEVINPEWMENMLMYAQRKDVGAVGAKLYFPDGRIQHAGVILKLGAHRIAGHGFYGAGGDSLGYMGRLCYAQDCSAVTAACLMVSKEKYEQVGGLNEDFVVAFNDVDFCLKLREAGYLNIFTPFAELKHYESASRGAETGEKAERFNRECDTFRKRWAKELEAGDPFYNPNFSLDTSMYDPVI